MVSVIIPYFNTPIHLTRRALESVVAQNTDGVEVVVVDDGSAPDSAASLETLLAEFEPVLDVRLLRQPNGGAARARNRAIEAAGREIVALLDSDDYWAPGKLRAQLDYLASHPDVWLVCGAAEVYDERTGERRVRGGAVLRSYFSGDHRHLYVRILARNRVNNMTVCFRKAPFIGLGGYDPRYSNAHDAELFLRACREGLEMRYLDRVLAVQVYHGGNISLRRDRKRACWLEILDQQLHDPPAFLAELPAHETRPELARAWFKLGRYARWAGRRALAREAFGRSFRLAPTGKRAVRWLGAWVGL